MGHSDTDCEVGNGKLTAHCGSEQSRQKSCNDRCGSPQQQHRQ